MQPICRALQSSAIARPRRAMYFILLLVVCLVLGRASSATGMAVWSGTLTWDIEGEWCFRSAEPDQVLQCSWLLLAKAASLRVSVDLSVFSFWEPDCLSASAHELLWFLRKTASLCLFLLPHLCTWPPLTCPPLSFISTPHFLFYSNSPTWITSAVKTPRSPSPSVIAFQVQVHGSWWTPRVSPKEVV